jgi:nitrous oxide reductase accessory protein NosL
MNKSLVFATLVAAVALAACGKKEEAAPVVTPPAPPLVPLRLPSATRLLRPLAR